MRDDDPVSDDAVRWAYRLMLGREPESQAAVDAKLKAPSLLALRDAFLQSDEFQEKRPTAIAPARFERQPLDVEVDLSRQSLGRLLRATSRMWASLGATDPYWSVLSDERYRSAAIAQSLEQFRVSGREEVARNLALLRSNGVDPESLNTVLEYGCGVGRVTRWLSEAFNQVIGWDVSAPHLELAESYFREETRTNVTLQRVTDVRDLANLPSSDLIYSFLVLQHNPPPVIAHTLRQLLGSLRPGGVALFQLPTYKPGYSFSYSKYVKGGLTTDRRSSIEMHLLPQHHIFEMLTAASCDVLEVLDDGMAGSEFVSNTFVVRRAASGSL